MRVALVQYNPEFESPEINKQRIRSLLEEYAPSADVLIFPEMTLTGFTMQSTKFAETADGFSVNFFIELAQKFDCHILFGMIFKEGENIYNSLVHLNRKGSLVTRYDKVHPFSFAGEHNHYRPGTHPIITDIDGLSFGLSICYDVRFPELYRNYGKEKVDVLVAIANWPKPRIAHWRTLLQARAIENQAFMIGVNRVGSDPLGVYTGYSSIINPKGEIVAEVESEETIIVAEVNQDEIRQVRNKFPFLDDIRLL
mgnify:FL=1